MARLLYCINRTEHKHQAVAKTQLSLMSYNEVTHNADS